MTVQKDSRSWIDPVPTEGEVWYRYVDQPTGNFSLDGDYLGSSGVRVVEDQFKVKRHTPCGVVLDVYGTEKFVNASSRKKFACPTAEEAMESFRLRKRRQLSILRSQVKRVEDALSMVEHGPVWGKSPLESVRWPPTPPIRVFV